MSKLIFKIGMKIFFFYLAKDMQSLYHTKRICRRKQGRKNRKQETSLVYSGFFF